jgi:hypothetical protein
VLSKEILESDVAYVSEELSEVASVVSVSEETSDVEHSSIVE